MHLHNIDQGKNGSEDFIKKFELADDFVVEDAGLQDGLLCVKLKKIIPEEKKEKIIDIK